MENMVKVSTSYSSTIRIKNKTFVLYLREPNKLEFYGAGIDTAIPMVIEIENMNNEYSFIYDETEIWEKMKNYRKELRKLKKDMKGKK